MGRGGAATKATAAAAAADMTASEAAAIEEAVARMEAEFETDLATSAYAVRDAHLAALADRKARLLSLPAEVLSMDVSDFASSGTLAVPGKGRGTLAPDFDAAEAAAAAAAEAAKRRMVTMTDEYGVEVKLDLAALAPETAAVLQAKLAAAGAGAKKGGAKKGKK